MESLAAALRRVRGEVGGPHTALRTQTVQLANLHSALDLLRHLIHRLKLVAKLRVRARVPITSRFQSLRWRAPHASPGHSAA